MVQVTLPEDQDLTLGLAMVPSWDYIPNSQSSEVYIFGGMEKESFVYDLEKSEVLPLCKASSRSQNLVKMLSRGKV